MADSSELKRYIELLLSECASVQEGLMLALIFNDGEPIKAPSIDEEVFLKTCKLLDSYKGAKVSQNLVTEMKNLKQSINNVVSLPAQKSNGVDLSVQKACVQDVLDSLQRFSIHVRSCVDLNASQDGVDPDTGLVVEGLIEKDFRRESERFERDGQPFCFCLIRSDLIWKGETDNSKAVFKTLARATLTNLRSFDDAYLLGEYHILVSLKHTTTSGAVKFFERLQRYIGSQKSGEETHTITGCITEPVAKQVCSDILEDLANDLDVECKDVSNDYVIMSETTDLQKFLGKEE